MVKSQSVGIFLAFIEYEKQWHTVLFVRFTLMAKITLPMFYQSILQVGYELMIPLIFWRATDQVDSVTQGGKGSINVSPPLVTNTVNGDVNVSIGVPNGNTPEHAFILIFKGGHEPS